MNWGKSIVLAFVLFALFIGVLVTVCVRQDVSLVSKNYYNEELDYQAQMERVRNTATLVQKPEIDLVDDQSVRVSFDFRALEAGKLVLYSPADIREDKIFRLEPSASPVQTFSVGELKRGNYKIKMTWTANGKQFYFEKSIYI